MFPDGMENRLPQTEGHSYLPGKEDDRSVPFLEQLFQAVLSHFSFALKAEVPFGGKKQQQN